MVVFEVLSKSQAAAVSAVSIALAISAILGIVILKTDGYLWAAAPSHAYGLVAFAALDGGLAIAVWRVTKLGFVGSLLLGVAQFSAMIGDVLMGEPTGLPLSQWQQYILGDTYFIALLFVQPALIVIAFVMMRYLRFTAGSYARLAELLHGSDR